MKRDRYIAIVTSCSHCGCVVSVRTRRSRKEEAESCALCLDCLAEKRANRRHLRPTAPDP